MERTGVAFWGGVSVEELVGCVRLAEEQGFHSAWVVESYADVFSVLSACAAVTDSIQLATGVTTVFTRNPTTIAIASATVDTVSRGRFILGLGAGHREIHAQRDNPDREHQVPFWNARQRLRETVDITRRVVKAAFDGESVSYQGEVFEFEEYKPWFVPYRDRVPVYLAALTRGTTELAGEVADGVVPVFFSEEGMKAVVEQVATGARRVGREPKDVDVACYLPVCVSNDKAEAYRALRYLVSFHISAYRYYQTYFVGAGYVREVEGVLESLGRGECDNAAEWVNDAMVEAVGVGGTAEECRARISEYRRAGVTLPIIYPVHPGFTGYRPDAEAAEGIKGAIRGLGEG